MKHKIISSVFVVLLSFFAAAAIAALGAAVCLKCPIPRRVYFPLRYLLLQLLRHHADILPARIREALHLVQLLYACHILVFLQLLR